MFKCVVFFFNSFHFFQCCFPLLFLCFFLNGLKFNPSFDLCLAQYDELILQMCAIQYARIFCYLFFFGYRKFLIFLMLFFDPVTNKLIFNHLMCTYKTSTIFKRRTSANWVCCTHQLIEIKICIDIIDM